MNKRWTLAKPSKYKEKWVMALLNDGGGTFSTRIEAIIQAIRMYQEGLNINNLIVVPVKCIDPDNEDQELNLYLAEDTLFEQEDIQRHIGNLKGLTDLINQSESV